MGRGVQYTMGRGSYTIADVLDSQLQKGGDEIFHMKGVKIQ